MCGVTFAASLEDEEEEIWDEDEGGGEGGGVIPRLGWCES
jgi:hypothetical protein